MRATTAVRRFGFRQARRGAIIMGILAGFMITVQGLGYVESYPDQASRQQFAATLGSAPALGILYGETKNLSTPEGYMYYRTAPFLGFIASIWATLTITRLLRGQEEDGHWEIITSKRISSRGASWQTIAGFGLAFLMAFSISLILTAFSSLLPDINLNLATSAAINLTIFLPAAVFAAVGALASQFTASRRRAIMYTIVPLIGFFVLRALGNSIEDLYWIKKLSPFGWSDLASPVTDPQLQWLLFNVLIIPVFILLAVYFVGKRDISLGLFRESEWAKSRFRLLKNPVTFALRQNGLTFLAWGGAALMMSGIIAAISKVAVEAVKKAPNLAGAIQQLSQGSTNDFALAFIGAGMTFTVMVLLIMVAFNVGSIWKDEAKTYLDSLLTQPVRRSSWLAGRLGLLVTVLVIILLASGLLSWWLAIKQDISLDLGNFLLVCSSLSGVLIFTVGVGALAYGFIPRLAAAAVYIVIAWSFIFDLLDSVFEINEMIAKTSLFHYISLSPADAPDWKAFAWLASLGIVMAIVGTMRFSRRDIVSE